MHKVLIILYEKIFFVNRNYKASDDERRRTMITREKVKIIFSEIATGTTLTVRQIQNLVQKQCPPIPADLEPYVKTRNTKYPVWHHVIQCVLYEYKIKGVVIHNPASQSYTF